MASFVHNQLVSRSVVRVEFIFINMSSSCGSNFTIKRQKSGIIIYRWRPSAPPENAKTNSHLHQSHLLAQNATLNASNRSLQLVYAIAKREC